MEQVRHNDGMLHPLLLSRAERHHKACHGTVRFWFSGIQAVCYSFYHPLVLDMRLGKSCNIMHDCKVSIEISENYEKIGNC